LPFYSSYFEATPASPGLKPRIRFRKKR